MFQLFCTGTRGFTCELLCLVTLMHPYFEVYLNSDIDFTFYLF